MTDIKPTKHVNIDAMPSACFTRERARELSNRGYDTASVTKYIKRQCKDNGFPDEVYDQIMEDLS